MTFHSIIASRLFNYLFLTYIFGICRDVWRFHGTSTFGVWADHIDMSSVPLYPQIFANQYTESITNEVHEIVAIVLDLNDPTGFEVNVTNINGLSYKEICSPRIGDDKNGGDRLITSVYMGNQLVWRAELGEYCKCVTVTSSSRSPGPDNADVYEDSTGKRILDSNNNNNVYAPDMINYAGSDRRYKGRDDGVPRVRIELIFIELLSSIKYAIKYFYSLTPLGGSTTHNISGPTIKEIDQRRYNLFLYRMGASRSFDPEYIDQVDRELARENAHKIDGIRGIRPRKDAHFGHPEGDGNINLNFTVDPTHHIDRFTKLKYIADTHDFSVEEVYYSRSDPTMVLESVERVRNKKADAGESQLKLESVDKLAPLLRFTNASKNIGDNVPASGREEHKDSHLALTPKPIPEIPVTGAGVVDIIKPELNPNVKFDYEVNDGIPIISIKPMISKFIKPIIAVYESTNKVWYDKDSRMIELRAFSGYGEYKLIELTYQTKEVSGEMGSNEGGLYDEYQAGDMVHSQEGLEENSENSGEKSHLHYGESFIKYLKKINNQWEEVKIKDYEKAFKEMRKSIVIVDSVLLDVSVVDNKKQFFQKGEVNDHFQAITYFPLTGYRLNSVMDDKVVVWRSKKKRCVAVVVIRDLPSRGVTVSLGNEVVWDSGASRSAGEIRFLKLELAGGIGTNGMRIKNRYYKKVEVSIGSSYVKEAEVNSTVDGSGKEKVGGDDTTNRAVEGNNVDNAGSEVNESPKAKYRYVRITEPEFERSINGQLNTSFNISIQPVGDGSKIGGEDDNVGEIKDVDVGGTKSDKVDVTIKSDVNKKDKESKRDILDDSVAIEAALQKIRLDEGPGKIEDTSTVCDTATTTTASRVAERQRLPGEITEADKQRMKASEGMSLDSSFTVGMGEETPEYEGEKLHLEELGDNEDDRVSMISLDKVQKWLNNYVNKFGNKEKKTLTIDSEGNESTDGEEIDQSEGIDNKGDMKDKRVDGRMGDGAPNTQKRRTDEQANHDKSDEDYEFREEDVDIVYNRRYTSDTYNGITYRTFTPPRERVFKGIRVYGSYLWKAGENEHTDFVRVFYPDERPEMGLFRLFEEGKPEPVDIYFMRDEDGWKFVTSDAMMRQFRLFVVENYETRSL